MTRREGFTMVYPFTTYTTIFGPDQPERPNLNKLNAYFRELFLQGTPSPEGKGSVSKGKKLMIEVEPFDTDLIRYAFDAGYDGMGKEQHETVQNHLHAKDPFTYATEIPVWSTEEEVMDCNHCMDEIDRCEECDVEKCKRHAECDHLLHGHIDIIRYLPNDKIEIPDFKPGAEKETKAASQVWKYMWLLSLRTGIPIEDMFGCYFDGYYAYQLNV